MLRNLLYENNGVVDTVHETAMKIMTIINEHIPSWKPFFTYKEEVFGVHLEVHYRYGVFRKAYSGFYNHKTKILYLIVGFRDGQLVDGEKVMRSVEHELMHKYQYDHGLVVDNYRYEIATDSSLDHRTWAEKALGALTGKYRHENYDLYDDIRLLFYLNSSFERDAYNVGLYGGGMYDAYHPRTFKQYMETSPYYNVLSIKRSLLNATDQEVKDAVKEMNTYLNQRHPDRTHEFCDRRDVLLKRCDKLLVKMKVKAEKTYRQYLADWKKNRKKLYKKRTEELGLDYDPKWYDGSEEKEDDIDKHQWMLSLKKKNNNI